MTNKNYRKGIIAIILCKSKALIVEKQNVGWQFVQGGIEPNETSKEALLRELEEEINIKYSDISSIKETELTRKFDWPTDLQKKYGKIGQEQVLFIVELYNQDVNLTEDVLIDYIWLPFKEAVEMLSFDDLKTLLSMLIQSILKKFIPNNNLSMTSP